MALGMLGKYERLDVLGHGVSGIVYLAKDTLLNKQVALKEVDVQSGDMRRFLEEARVMDRLRHPNIVRVNNVDRIEGKVVIDMEYVRGQNLQEILRQESTLPADRAFDIVAQVLDALDYAHQMQTVHRDIKPANILIGRDGAVKLVDFGLAEILATNAYAGGAGTYAYMAPEDFAEDDRSDQQSDIWAMGVTLYEMLSGQRPFNVTKVKDPFAWKRALETEFPTLLAVYRPDLHAQMPGLQTVLDHALSREKRDRYQTAGEFRDDVIRLRQGHDVAPPQRTRRGPILRRPHAQPAPIPMETGSNTGGNAIPQMDLNERANAGVYASGQNAPLPWWERTTEPRTQNSLVSSQAPNNQYAKPYPAEQEDATVASVPKGRTRPRLPFVGRKSDLRLEVEPGRVDFGAVRKGESPTVKITVRTIGAEGDIAGRVLHAPGWLTVHPTAFDRVRQSVTLTAHTDRAWETGEFHENVRIETSAGQIDIPVRLEVLKPRRSFSEVAAWYVPLFVAALLPAVAVALANTGGHNQDFILRYVPGATTATGLLSVMLLLICIAADVGIGERIACGVLTAVMCAVLGVSVGGGHGASSSAVSQGVERAFVAAAFLGGILLLQLLHFRKWKLWAWSLLILGFAIGGALLRILA